MKFVSKFEKITYIGMWVCYSLMIVSFVFFAINGSVWNLDWLDLFLKIMLIISIVSLCFCLGLHSDYTSNGTEEELQALKKIEALRLVVKNSQDSNFLKRQELDKYHKIEEELGIDLVTLFKATFDGVYYVSFGQIINTKDVGFSVAFCKEYLLIIDAEIEHSYHIKDYGKTWALTKKELK